MIGQDKKESFAYYDGDDDNDSGYEEMESLSKPEANYVAANLDLSWVGTIYFKYIYFKSLAYYFNGLQLEANKKYGSSIAYLTKSKDIIKQVHSITLRAISKGHGDVYELLDNYKYQKDALEIKLNDLNKDNDLIYHDIVPSLVTLPEIKPMDSTKIIRINENAMLKEINEQNYNNFLNNVVPFNIHELSSLYSEEKSQFLRNELDLVEVSNEETSSILEYLKLPKSLVEIKELINKDTQPFEIPNEILTKVREVSSNFDQDETNKHQIDGIRKQIFEKISEIERLGQSSFSGREETIQLKKALYEATNSDNKLFSLIDRPLYEILSKGPQSKSFKQLFAIETEHQPEVSLLDIDETTDNQAIMTKIKRIEDLLHDIHSVKSNKMKLVEDLKKEIHSDDISNILILNSKLKSENEIKSVIFPEELKKFAPFNEQLDWLIKQEKKFVSELRSAWESLNSNKEIKKIISKQTRMDSKIIDENGRIQQFYDNWSKYHVGLSKGKQFYQGLLDQCIRVKNEIEQGLKFDEQFKNMKVSEAPPTFSNQYQQQYQAAPAPTAQYQQPIVNRSSTGEFPSQQQPSNFYRPENQPKPPSFSGLDNQNFPPSINRQPSLPRQYENDSGSFTRGGLNEYMQQQPPQLPPQPIINRASTGGSFNYGQGYQSPQSTGYVRPPQLPPKQRMQGDLQPSIPMMPQQQIMPPQQQQPQQQPPLFNQKTPNSNRSESNLIYDQPSTYNPNMYNFFSSSNAK
ncbi:BRO1 [[Candida] subhashii]|uniref:BRO domain-containing protein 1 n=1 Tax=[Candida] subhashii TaxID=561895 RepID=A0A8J5UIJ3_9ASCO|nr:BRO1 [[Candida] subhashii]KAG7663678.1 BRO1 [[Candida] subhashii]